MLSYFFPENFTHCIVREDKREGHTVIVHKFVFQISFSKLKTGWCLLSIRYVNNGSLSKKRYYSLRIRTRIGTLTQPKFYNYMFNEYRQVARFFLLGTVLTE
jgi:hypothetical protein